MNIKLEIKKLLRHLGLEIQLYNFRNGEEPLLKKLIKEHNIQTIIDVGANEGQYAQSLLKNNYSGVIYSFEPISKPFETLQRRANKNSSWKVIQKGIGSKDEELSINISENIVSSSIYQVGEISLSAEPSTKIVRQENIKVTSIDNFFVGENDLKGEVMLKLDVQGYELEALKGAIKSLENIKLLQVELSFVPVYNNAPLFTEVVSFLEKHGFELFTLFPGFKDRNNGRLLQADGIFFNSTANSGFVSGAK